MKMRISDLLDGYREDALITGEATPLSLKRIEKMTMGAIKPQKKHPIRRFVPKVLAAAAMISMLTVTAIAEEREWKVSDWFRPAVAQQLQEKEKLDQLHDQEQWQQETIWKQTVNESHLKVIDEHGKIVNQSVTQNGATVTLLALYGDEYVLNLYFRVEAPEGTVLPDGLKYRFAKGTFTAVRPPPGYDRDWGGSNVPEAIPDEDPTDNVKDFILSLKHGRDGSENPAMKQWNFHDDVPKTVVLPGFYIKTGYEKVDYRYKDTYERLFLGPFEFDITNTHEVKRKEIDVTGCEYSGHVQTAWHPGKEIYEFDYTYTVTPTRLTVSPFTAEIELLHSTSGDYQYAIVDFQIVMKDGTTHTYGEFGGYVCCESGDGWAKNVVRFTTPIDPEQIDYILIGNLEHGDTIHKVKP